MDDKEFKKKYPTFCILPFTHMSSSNEGNYRVCCTSEEMGEGGIMKSNGQAYNMRNDSITEVWNSDFYKQLRLDLINGVKNSACDYCWNYENSGAYSKRQKNMDEKHNMYPDYEVYIKEALANDGVLSELPVDLDIRVGTLCNLKCITCYPGASSLHEDEGNEMEARGMKLPELHTKYYRDRLKTFNIKPESFNPKNVDEVVVNVANNLDPSLQIARHMSLVGGEPLVNKTTSKLLEECVRMGRAPEMMLQIITNLSVINPKTIGLLEQFKWPMLCVSWDHVDPDKFNFIRFPLDYKTFKDNFETVWEHPKIEKKLSTTWSIFNIFDFADIFEAWEEVSNRDTSRPFVVNHGLVYYPNYFSTRYLELEQKEEVCAKTMEYYRKHSDYLLFKNNPWFVESLVSLRDYMGDTYPDHESVCKERTRVLKLYDTMRGTNYKQLFPFIKDYE